jgi:hypothetical protein
VVDDARGIHRVSTPTGGRETYVDPRGLEVERPFVRACCLAPGTCQRQPFEPVPGPSFFDAQFQQHWERRHAGQSMPPEGQRWRLWSPQEAVGRRPAPPDPANAGWHLQDDGAERVVFMHTACGFNGNTTRKNFSALRDRHAREQHPC